MGKSKTELLSISILTYFKTNWKKISVWLIGGGLITLATTWKLFTSGPNVQIKGEYMAYSEAFEDRQAYHNFTVDFSIVNNGDKPYFPQEYRLNVYQNDKMNVFYPMPIPDNAIVGNIGQMAITYDPKKDLTRVNKVEPDGIVTGFIDFVMLETPKNRDISQLNYEYIQIEITDISGKIIKSDKYPCSEFSSKNEYHPRSGTQYQKP